mmetsp:Transcript_52016/g.59410  ORF Transcript_52016/g.59410 Transcript_52016/m.59410 type:complete len:306 (-) Transcript_52016:19-936(-)
MVLDTTGGDDGLSLSFVGVLLVGRLRLVGVLLDLGVDLLVGFFDGRNLHFLQVLDPFAELTLVLVSIFGFQQVHIFLDVNTHDVLSVDFGVEFTFIIFITTLGNTSGESGFAMGDVETSITSSLKSTEDSGTSGSSGETNIEDSLEGLSSVFLITVLHFVMGVIVVTGNFGNTSEGLFQTDSLQDSAGQQQTGTVSSGVVGKTTLESPFAQFSGVSLSQDLVTNDGSISNLADNLGVGDSDNHSVFRSVVLVLVLGAQSDTGIVVGLSFSSSSEFDLVSLVVGLVLNNFDESHLCLQSKFLCLCC